ncbi:hypothetical protein TGRUB_305230 [Toxoplasma gondii RUB]|uniref:Uncharacterized protein n=1 Tax=Toxoplasma gondii RUB TaxID=935652 RepID=A0A086LRH3_TOXGO|nr:hypothetical protein TGRUB_305230 [Toxoplasma gondii RUB]
MCLDGSEDEEGMWKRGEKRREMRDGDAETAEEGLEIRETAFGLEQRAVYRHLDRRHEEIDDSVFLPSAFDLSCRRLPQGSLFYSPLRTTVSSSHHRHLERTARRKSCKKGTQVEADAGEQEEGEQREEEGEQREEEGEDGEEEGEDGEEERGEWSERSARSSHLVDHCGETAMVSLLIVGDQNAGKSTFLHAFCRDRLGARFLQLTSFLPFLQASFSNARLLFLREQDFQEKGHPRRKQETANEDSRRSDVLPEERKPSQNNCTQPDPFSSSSPSSSSSPPLSSSSLEPPASALLSVCRDEQPFLDSDVARALVLFTLEDFLFFCSEFSVPFTVSSPSPSSISPSPSSSGSLLFSASTRYVALHLLELGGDHLDRLLHFFAALRSSEDAELPPTSRDDEEPALDAARQLLREEKTFFKRVFNNAAEGLFGDHRLLRLSATKERERADEETGEREDKEEKEEKEEKEGEQRGENGDEEDRNAQELLRLLRRSAELVGDAEQIVYFVNCRCLFPRLDSRKKEEGHEAGPPSTEASRDRDDAAGKTSGETTRKSSLPSSRPSSQARHGADSCFSSCSRSSFSSFGLLSVEGFASLLRKLHALATVQSLSREDSFLSSPSASVPRQGLVFACSRLPDSSDRNSLPPRRASPLPSSSHDSSPSCSSLSSSSPSCSSLSSSSLWFRENFRRALKAVRCVSRAPEGSASGRRNEGDSEAERKGGREEREGREEEDDDELYAEFERIVESVKRKGISWLEGGEASMHGGDNGEGDAARRRREEEARRKEEESWRPFEEDETTGEVWVRARKEEEQRLYHHPVFLFLSAFFSFLWFRRQLNDRPSLSTRRRVQRCSCNYSLTCVSRFHLRGVFPLRLLTEEQTPCLSSPSLPSPLPSPPLSPPSSYSSLAPVSTLSGSAASSVHPPFSVASLVRFLVCLLQCFCQEAASSVFSRQVGKRQQLPGLPASALSPSKGERGGAGENEGTAADPRPEEGEEKDAESKNGEDKRGDEEGGRDEQEGREGDREDAGLRQDACRATALTGPALTGELGRLTLLAFLRVAEQLRRGTRPYSTPTSPSSPSSSVPHSVVDLWISGVDVAEALEEDHDYHGSRCEKASEEGEEDFLPPRTVLNAFPLLARGLVGISAASPFSPLSEPFPPVALELRWAAEADREEEREEREAGEGGRGEPGQAIVACTGDPKERKRRMRSLLVVPLRRTLSFSLGSSSSSSSCTPLSEGSFLAIRMPFHSDFFRLLLARLRRNARCGPLPPRFWTGWGEAASLGSGRQGTATRQESGSRKDERLRKTEGTPRSAGRERHGKRDEKDGGRDLLETRQGQESRDEARGPDTSREGAEEEAKGEMDRGEGTKERSDTEEKCEKEERAEGGELEEKKTKELPEILHWNGDDALIRRAVGAAVQKQIRQLGSRLSSLFEKRSEEKKTELLQQPDTGKGLTQERRSGVRSREREGNAETEKEKQGEENEKGEEEKGGKGEERGRVISSLVHSICDEAHILMQLVGDLALLGSFHGTNEREAGETDHQASEAETKEEQGVEEEREERKERKEREGKSVSWTVERWRPCVEADGGWKKVVFFLSSPQAREARERSEEGIPRGDRERSSTWIHGLDALLKEMVQGTERSRESGGKRSSRLSCRFARSGNNHGGDAATESSANEDSRKVKEDNCHERQERRREENGAADDGGRENGEGDRGGERKKGDAEKRGKGEGERGECLTLLLRELWEKEGLRVYSCGCQPIEGYSEAREQKGG